jgi:molybdenum cofactor cytidylyltransferase
VQLRGDHGARPILERHRAEIELLECDDPGILVDIDTPADLR